MLSHRLFNVLHTCIALQISAGLDAILDFSLSIPINTDSLQSLICAPTTSNICEAKLFQPVTGNTPLTAKFEIFDQHNKMIHFS